MNELSDEQWAEAARYWAESRDLFTLAVLSVVAGVSLDDLILGLDPSHFFSQADR